jgi:hypothetical protein
MTPVLVARVKSINIVTEKSLKMNFERDVLKNIPFFYFFHQLLSLNNFLNNKPYLDAHYLKPKTKKMKKLFSMLALFSLLAVACKDKKDDKTPEPTTTPTTTEPTTTPTTTEPTTTTTVPGVPKFSDPEVQKFANDYAAFMAEYKAGMNDPAKLADLTQRLQDWSKRSTDIGMKLATKPEEAKAWADWMLAMANDIMPK